MPTKTDIMRTQVRHLVNRSPFLPFEINLENGDRRVIEHPELIAFDPRENGNGLTRKIAIIANEVTITSTFDSISSVAEIDRGRPLSTDNE